MNKRTGKFYRRNEEEVMESLGLKPTKGSGAGWIEKADGQSEHVICELKSTDANSYRITLKDLHRLEHHATVSYKIPVFAVQFLKSNELFLLIKPEQLQDVAKYLETGKYNQPDILIGLDLSDHEDMTTINGEVVKSSKSAREQFMEEQQQKYRKEKSARWK